jgi:hypothetical protein
VLSPRIANVSGRPATDIVTWPKLVLLWVTGGNVIVVFPLPGGPVAPVAPGGPAGPVGPGWPAGPG